MLVGWFFGMPKQAMIEILDFVIAVLCHFEKALHFVQDKLCGLRNLNVGARERLEKISLPLKRDRNDIWN